MGEIRAIEDRIAQAASRWPQLHLRRKTADEGGGPCPFCHGGKDRFLIFADGGYWCRQCNTSGWLDEKDTRQLTQAEITNMRLRRLEQQQAEHERRLSALEKMHSLMYVAQFYHRALLDPENEAYEYWLAQGMHAETIDRYALGYCSRCPTDHDRRASYTIPVIIGGKLYNIRHRLAHAEGGDKYRPHMPGLPTVLFNADHLREAPPDRILITEGEKKSIIADQLGFPNVGLMGKSGFDERWVEKFQRFRVVCVLLDPDATEDAIVIARLFEKRGRVVSLYDKLDDLVVRWKATATDLEWYIRRARLV